MQTFKTIPGTNDSSQALTISIDGCFVAILFSNNKFRAFHIMHNVHHNHVVRNVFELDGTFVTSKVEIDKVNWHIEKISISFSLLEWRMEIGLGNLVDFEFIAGPVDFVIAHH